MNKRTEKELEKIKEDIDILKDIGNKLRKQIVSLRKENMIMRKKRDLLLLSILFKEARNNGSFQLAYLFYKEFCYKLLI